MEAHPFYTITARRQAEADYTKSDPANRERHLAVARVDTPPDPSGTELPSHSTSPEIMMLLQAAQAVPRDALIFGEIAGSTSRGPEL